MGERQLVVSETMIRDEIGAFVSARKTGTDTIVLAPCAARKSIPPATSATAVSLLIATQDELETAWMAKVAALPTVASAADLYAGRGASLAREAARLAAADLLFVSAGLGLVRSGRQVPTYGITVAERGDDAIARRTQGRFDAAAWWTAVSRGPLSEDLGAVVGGTLGLVLVALTAPYAALLRVALDGLDDSAIGRLRIFGHGLAASLPERIRPAVMPYDARLDAAVPGTRTDFAQRALRHFCIHATADGSLDAAANAAEVEATLASHSPPERVTRLRETDEEIVTRITAHLRNTTGIGRILRIMRDEDGVACEQARFGRLYDRALTRGAAA